MVIRLRLLNMRARPARGTEARWPKFNKKINPFIYFIEVVILLKARLGEAHSD